MFVRRFDDMALLMLLKCFKYIVGDPPRPLSEEDIWFQIGHVHEQQKDVGCLIKPTCIVLTVSSLTRRRQPIGGSWNEIPTTPRYSSNSDGCTISRARAMRARRKLLSILRNLSVLVSN